MRTLVRLLLLCSLLLPGLASAQRVLGDFILGQSVVCPWNTFDKSGNSATPGTAGTLYVSKDGDTSTEKSVVANLSGTDTRGVDSDAGRHRAVIPTTDAYFTAPATYEVIARGTVVDSQTVSSSICYFTMEYLYPLRGLILLHATEDTGASSTTSVIELTGNVITSDGQYKYNRLWDITDGWSRAIIDSNAASDNVTIYPDAPAAPTNGATLYVTLDVIYPTNFFDPATTVVTVGRIGATVGGSTAITNNSGANFESVFENGGGSVGSNAQIGTIATNVTGVDLLGSGTTLAANIRDAVGMLAYGQCSVGSTTTSCINSSLTQADNYWAGWTMIIVQGQPPRCVRAFTASTDALSWPANQALPSTASLQKFVLLAAPECRNP